MKKINLLLRGSPLPLDRFNSIVTLRVEYPETSLKKEISNDKRSYDKKAFKARYGCWAKKVRNQVLQNHDQLLNYGSNVFVKERCDIDAELTNLYYRFNSNEKMTLITTFHYDC